MKIFFIGDIVGKPGRHILSEKLEKIVEEKEINFVVANGENAAGGNGITKGIVEELLKCGVDAITMGDHIWDQRTFDCEISTIAGICKPANLPLGNPGKDYLIIEKKGVRLGVFCLLGQTLMKIKADCPFHAADRIVNELESKCDYIFLDMHAETSSEKISLAWYLDGRVTALVGTHTHVPTCDGRILENGTGFLTDVGMTGPWNGCLGRDKGNIIKKFIDGRPRPFLMADGDVKICGCIIDVDEDTKKVLSISNYITPKFS